MEEADRRNVFEKPVVESMVISVLLYEAEAPSEFDMPRNSNPAASAFMAVSSNFSVDGTFGSNKSKSGNSVASISGSASPAKASSGMDFAILTARSASSERNFLSRTEDDTTACLLPQKTRKSTPDVPAYSRDSVFCSLHSAHTFKLSAAKDSAASAPQAFACSIRKAAASAKVKFSGIFFISLWKKRR